MKNLNSFIIQSQYRTVTAYLQFLLGFLLHCKCEIHSVVSCQYLCHTSTVIFHFLAIISYSVLVGVYSKNTDMTSVKTWFEEHFLVWTNS